MAQSTLFVRDVPSVVESETGWVEKYPRKRWQRWLVRVGAALPFAAIAVWYHLASGGDWSGTPNGELAARVGSLDWSGQSLEAIGALYPFLTSLTAALIPGGALGLGLAGSLVAGVLLQLVIKAIKRRAFRVDNAVALFTALAATPLFAYVATTNYEATMGLALFCHGMIDLRRFVSSANTQAGFRAGVLFACSALSDSTGLLAAPAAAAAGVFLFPSRLKSRGANVMVVLFPTVAMLGSLALLGTVFGAGPFALFGSDPGWDPALVSAFVASMQTPSGWAFLAPAAVLLVSGLVLGFRWASLTSVIITALILLAYFLAVTPVGTAGNAYAMQLIVAIAITPAFPRGWRRHVVTATGVLLFAIGWISAFSRTTLISWVEVLTAGGLS
ncbi:hypothetical protein [Microbacterium marinilacus]|uniref:Glycosyltransferase RgtA/B/C/D-like domain-containing protein n=1 Tax=Microbacterium marinilacus TaxID=415209 RepID=A0ABP7B4E1_9MICO|nr:hypothetical protein [Microbacterium marinilacus]MBY0687945.1 hypothetical protein [Microbacterium marinilacus]